MSGMLRAPGFPEAAVRHRARTGVEAAFPPLDGYGATLYGSGWSGPGHNDPLERLRLLPPVFMEQRLEKLIDLGREPMPSDVSLETVIGGFPSRLPFYVSAFGSTAAARGDLGTSLGRQAARLGIPLVVGENVVPVIGYGRLGAQPARALLARIEAYGQEGDGRHGGIVVQQSTEDADAEVWNLVYSDPAAQPFLEAGRLAFELKTGQGAKPGLGGMTLMDGEAAAAVAEQYALLPIPGDGRTLRASSPGTYTEEILRQQINLMRNNYPRARVWVKLHPGRDVGAAARVAWAAGADSVTVDGAEGGTGWAPGGFLDHVGLPLFDCLLAAGAGPGCLLAGGRIWEGTRAVKCLALGARGMGLGRAALVAVDEDPEEGLLRLAACLDLEVRMLISALGKYDTTAVNRDDVGPLPTVRKEEVPHGESVRG
ncbi:glutamate synthase-related protein [Streptomyces alfalfae]|uniref:Alpha-hydroxy-acid oxidizing protein n=1 Tax=Streptomyces alfalfae TaxID=1642299 RepID=A0A7T4PMZ4_9ACTN|nr:glutamate synthase-related protein [Streptomyces alfalfae]QQC92999.1 alpha-hydroxy-acid oxidizing protein [Streptomyces alfalfae]